MRPLALALLALLVVPASAAGKNANAPIRALWNSTPDHVQAGGTWDARLSLLQGPGGFAGDRVRPLIVVTKPASGAERRVPMTIDVAPNTFKAAVAFPRAGLYRVSLTRFDPRHPKRVTEIRPPVAIEPASPQTVPPAHAPDAAWLWVLAAGAALAALVAGRSIRHARA